MKVATRHFVRPEFMNHHQTLYAGYIGVGDGSCDDWCD